MKFALNHIIKPQLGYQEFLALAKNLDCLGVEFRNDFQGQELFGGEDPSVVMAEVEKHGLHILALAEVKMFNRWSTAKAQEAEALMKIAVAAGAPVVSLIPANDGQATDAASVKANLKEALTELKPMLESFGLKGFVEPLGFPISSLRYKRDAIEGIEAVGGQARFKLVHDTFHHTLASEAEIYPESTGIVHISGVVNPNIDVHLAGDGDRVLVDENDRLGNIAQIKEFVAAGFDGVFSFEPFAKEIQDLKDPYEALKRSIEFIKSQVI